MFQIVIPEFQGIAPVVSDEIKYKPTGEEVRVKSRSFEVDGVEFRESEIPGVFNSAYVLAEEADFFEKKLLESGAKFDRIP